MTATLREIGSAEAPAAPTYAQAVEVTGISRLLFVSGQIPEDPAGAVPAAFADQARLAWTNVIAQLGAAGMGLDNLVKVTVFLSDRRHIPDYRATRDEMLAGRRIGLTCIVCDVFDPAWLLEIEAVAAA
jgi:enamine deaminase RidA (YjgF/YER057c/UK114 family)